MNIDAVKRQIEESIPWRDGVLTVEQAFALVAEVERLCAEVAAERAAVVSALERWAEDGGDPWMSYCAERVRSGEHRREQKP